MITVVDQVRPWLTPSSTLAQPSVEIAAEAEPDRGVVVAAADDHLRPGVDQPHQAGLLAEGPEQRVSRDEPAAGREPAPLGPSPGFDNLVWHRPVTPGDTITYTLTITGKRALASRPGWGLLHTHNTGVNQKGEDVFAFDGKVMTAVRSGA